MNKRLHIIFKGSAKAKKNIRDGDTILTDDFKILTSKKYNTIINVDKSFDDKEKKVSEEVWRFLKEYYNDLPEIANSIYASVFRPLYSIIDQIGTIINEREIDEIVLYGGSEDVFFTLFYGEGEGESWLYKESWFFNGAIYQCYKNNINVIWEEKHKIFIFELLNIVRENIIHFWQLIGKLHDLIINNNVNKICSFEHASKKQYIAIADLQLQYNHLKKNIARVNNSDTIYLLHRNVIADENEKILYYRPLDFKTTFRIKKKNKRNCLQKKVAIKINNKEINISFAAVNKTINNFMFQYYYKYQQIVNCMNFISNISGSKIISNMTFGQDINIVNEIAKKCKLPHINIQYASMSKMLYPKTELADYYYLYAKNIYEFYRKYSDSYNYYLPIIQTPKQKALGIALKIAIIMQPDSFTQKYLEFMDNLFSQITSSNLSVRISIKPHYRQNMENKITELSLNSFYFINLIFS